MSDKVGTPLSVDAQTMADTGTDTTDSSAMSTGDGFYDESWKPGRIALYTAVVVVEVFVLLALWLSSHHFSP